MAGSDKSDPDASESATPDSAAQNAAQNAAQPDQEPSGLLWSSARRNNDIEDAEIVPSEPGDGATQTGTVLPTPEPVRPEPEPKPEPALPSMRQEAKPGPRPEPAPPHRAAPPPEPPRRSGTGSVILLLLAGVATAAIGYGLAQVVPDGWPIGTNRAEMQALTASVADQGGKIEALAAGLTELASKEPPPPDLSSVDALAATVAALEPKLAAMATDLAKTRDLLAALDSRINVLERRPAGGGAVSETALQAYEDEIKGLRALIDAQAAQSSTAGADVAAVAADALAQLQAAQAAAADLQAQAESTANLAAQRAALLRVEAALEAGGAFAGALDTIEALGTAIPEPLRAQAAGVPTVRDLQTSFADPARLALAAARKADIGTGALDRLGAFLRTQTGVRSLTPQDGDDPDAVLSRAEAAVAAGDLPAAFAELAALPEAAQAELAGWRASGQARLDALTALAALAVSLDK